MRALLQRVSKAEVISDGTLTGRIDKGLVILLGIEAEDQEEDLLWLADKIVRMRIFQDPDDKMNLSLLDVEGDVLIVSQFTLHASTKKGNRPSFIRAARPEQAIPLYESFKKEMADRVPGITTFGIFGADMKVSLTNDGPVTIWLDSKNKE